MQERLVKQEEELFWNRSEAKANMIVNLHCQVQVALGELAKHPTCHDVVCS
jgi:hypothetical protein